MSAKNPFIAGNWVRGKNFFGRQKLIEEILTGRRNYIWVAGTRRVGKTSLLKQIEYLTRESDYAKKYIALFWDLQGSQDLNGLKESLLESIEDAEEQFLQIDVDVDELEGQDLFSMLRTLKRKAKNSNLNLLLLCDEAEELINIEKNNPQALPKLRRFFQRGDNVYTILTATKRLGVLEQSSAPHTSPFLHGFVPPVYLTGLEHDEAAGLIRLWKFPDDFVTGILEKTDRHPYLIQLLCERLVEAGDLQKVVAEISCDDMIGHFFSIDFQNLQQPEKEILLRLLQNNKLTFAELQSSISESREKMIKQLFELMQLGFIKQENKHYNISNYFFAQWLEREKEKLYTDTTLKKAEIIAETPTTKESGVLPETGDRLGEHEILEKLGSGGMGVVFKGRDLKLNRLVALKILLPELATDPEVKKRFIVEAQSASAMNHRNICTIYRIGEEQGLNFISMEYIDGDDLRAWCKSHENDFSDKLDIAVQTGDGLLHAHNKGIVHRDVKPENIMLTEEKVVKITDFGLAKSLTSAEEHLTKEGTTLGTLSYMSPEQASGLKTDYRSDIFSFGIVLYELFTGQLPFCGELELSILYAILNEDPIPIRELKPDLPEGLEEIVSKALVKDKEKRYESMDRLVEDLAQLKLY